MEKPYEVHVPGVRAKFEDWIANRGGILVWENVDLSNPGAGNMFTPVRDAEGKLNDTNQPPHWTHRYKETRTDIKDFRFVKEMKEVKRFRVAVRRGTQGLMLKLTDASSKKVRAECEKAGPGSCYRFDYSAQEAIIEVPVWE